MTKKSPFASRDTITAGLKKLNNNLRKQNMELLSTIAQLEDSVKKLEFELNHFQRRNSELTVELEKMHKAQNAWLVRMCDELVATMRTGATEGSWPRRPNQG